MTPTGPVLPVTGAVTIRPVSGNVADGAALQNGGPRLTPGAVIQGVIEGMNREGDPLVKTDAGEFSLKLPIHLKSGSEVVLRMENTQGLFRARLLSVDGVKLADYLQTHGAAPKISSQTGLPQTNPNVASANIMDALGDDFVSLSQSATQRATTLSQILQNQPAMQAVLLSRSPMIGEILRQLPPNFSQPTRVQAGDQVMMKLLGFSLPASAAPPSSSGHASPAAATTSTPATTSNMAANAVTSSPVNPSNPSIVNPVGQRLPLPESNTASTPQNITNNTSASTAPTPSQPAVDLSPLTGARAPSPFSAATPQALHTASASISNVVAHLAAQEIDTLPLPTVNTTETPANPATLAQANKALPPMPSPSLNVAADGRVLVQATVLDAPGKGDWLVQTPLGTVRITPPVGLPLPANGQMVQLQLQSIRAATSQTAINSYQPMNASNSVEDGMSFLSLTEQWDTLDSVLPLLQSTAPNSTLLDMMPQAGPKLTTQMLFFMQALRRDDVSQWLGKEAMNILESRGRNDLIQRLHKDFGKLHDALEMPESKSPWQAMIFPFQHEQVVHMVRLFVHRDQDQEKQDESSSGGEGKPWKDTRFVLELELSHLGPMQLNGLVRRQEKTHFDLVVRSLKTLPPQTQQDIRTIFENAAAITGYQGSVMFEVDRHFPERPLERMIDPPADLTA